MSPNNSEKSWVWEQYDHTVMGDTIQKPGGDSGIIRIHGKNKGVALTVDSSAHYCLANPLLVESKLFVKLGEILFLLEQNQ